MLITEEYINNYFSDKKNHFLLWGPEDQFSPEENYYPVEYMSIFIPIRGNITFDINSEIRHVDTSNIQLFTKEITVKIIESSPDYQSVGIIFSKNYWGSTLVHLHPYLTLAALKPCLPITDAQKLDILSFVKYIKLLCDEGKSYDDVVLTCLVAGIFRYIGNLYHQFQLTLLQASEDRILTRFVEALYEYHMSHRDVAFYVKLLNISPSTFAHAVHKATGMSPLKCIDKYVTMKIASFLLNTDKTVKEIAAMFNFEDCSHFCKYFKKGMHVTPDEFRKAN